MKRYTAQEMRDMAEQILHTDDDWYEDAGYMLRQAADMIEREAPSEKSSQVVNAAAMREVLESIASMAEQIECSFASSDETVYAFMNESCLAHNILECARSVLSAPPRNCDLISDSQEALEAIHEDRAYVNNPIDERRLTVEWLFAEAKGETDGSK